MQSVRECPGSSTAAVIALMLCCLPALAGVDVEHDASVDFGDYRTFSWVQGDPARSPDLRRHLVRAIEMQLESAGLRRVNSGADLLIAIYVAAETEIMMAGGYINSVTWDVGVIASGVRTFTKGTIVVDIVDAVSNRGVWQGRATMSRREQTYGKLRKKIDRLTRKMFREFPPPYLSSQ